MSPIDFLKKPFRWLNAISRYKARTSGGPNFAYDLCVRKIKPEQKALLDLSCWEVAYNGAEPVRPATLERFVSAFEPCGFRREAFYPCYGLAEATLFVSGGLKSASPILHAVQSAALERDGIVAAATQAENRRVLVGCGRTWLDQEIAIVNPETLTRCPPDRVGEIWVSGPNVAQGYWNRPEETEPVFRACLAGAENGAFLRTGDLGVLKNGELYVTGRRKDLIIIDGRNLYPQDIELTVEQSHPAFRPGCCAAFAVDVSGTEQLVVMAEVDQHRLAGPSSDPAQGATVNTLELVKAVRQAISRHHDVPTQDIILLQAGSIPKTSSGKIQRYACRAGYLAGSLDGRLGE